MIPRQCLRTFVDPLYGSQELPGYICELIRAPEVQRLRYIRLSNIDSLQMPGIAGITRFEHSIGTCLLAIHVADRLSLDKRERAILTIGALLHDVAITPFGHLMEEAYKYARIPYNHERVYSEAITGSTGIGNINFRILGSYAGLARVLRTGPLKKLEIQPNEPLQLSQGLGRLGPLIAGTVDLDNIDNVCRVAFHMGMDIRRTLPLDVASGFFIDENRFCFNDKAVPALYEWLATRERLYERLMTNPYDFTAKALIVEAISIALRDSNEKALPSDEAWKWTDAQLLTSLQKYEPTREIIQTVLAGTLREPIGMYWIKRKDAKYDLCDVEGLQSFRSQYASRLGLEPEEIIPYVIKDKRKRVIDNLVFKSSQKHQTIGESSELALVGVTSLKKTLADDRNADIELVNLLTDLCNGNKPQSCDPINKTHTPNAVHESSAGSLFPAG